MSYACRTQGVTPFSLHLCHRYHYGRHAYRIRTTHVIVVRYLYACRTICSNCRPRVHVICVAAHHGLDSILQAQVAMCWHSTFATHAARSPWPVCRLSVVGRRTNTYMFRADSVRMFVRNFADVRNLGIFVVRWTTYNKNAYDKRT